MSKTLVKEANKVNRMIKKKFVLLSILLLFVIPLVLSVLNIKTTWVSAGEYPAIYIDPAITNTTALGPGTNFTISIKTDYNGSDIWGWDFTLTYNPLALNFIDVINGDLITEAVDPDFDFKLEILNETTVRALACFSAYPKPVPLTSGPGTFANVTFMVVRKAASNLTLGPDTVLQGYTEGINPETGEIEPGYGHLYNVIDASKPPGATEPPYGSDHIQHGYFDNRFPHDVAVGSVTAQAEATVGFVSIDVEVVNFGKSLEIVEVAVSYDTTIDTKTVTLAVGESETASFSWNITGLAKGIYTINATATILESTYNPEGIDDDPADNWKTTTFLLKHDVAVGSVTAPAKRAVGDIVPVSVEVVNIGSLTELANVTIRHDSTYIDSQNLTLLVGESETALLSWNTTGLAQGNYTLNATATIPVDDDPTNNWKTTTTFLVGHDVAIISLDAPAEAAVGDLVFINVTVTNVGAHTEDVNVTIRHDSTYIDSQNLTLLVGESETALLSWNTTGLAQGNYTLNATATIPVDDDPTNNWKTTTTFLVGHDVAIISLDAPAEAAVGDLVFINVTVTNVGAHTEDVNVTIRHDSTYIDSQNVALAKGESKTALLSWNTTGLTKGNYTINATATIPEDADPTDNWKTTTILLAVHKVAVASISAPYTVYIGENVTIEVLVINTGGFNETFEVVVSYDGTHIDSENITLAPGPAETLFFTWNTAGVDPASYWINATATVEGDVDPTDNWKTKSIDVKPPPGTIVGTVTDASTGLPIQGANVTANGDYNITDADGYYMITSDPGDYNITASAAGYYSNSTSETVITEQTITVDFELTPLPGVIAGTVTDASTGDPISGANVTANGVSVSTGADGSYSIELAPGNYTVTVSKDGYESSSETNITVITGNTTTVDFELTPTPGIPWYLYVAAAGVVAIIMVAVAFYFLRIRKPKPT